MLHRVEFRAIRRQGHKHQVLWYPQAIGSMPASAIQKHETQVFGKCLRGMVQEDGHDLGVHPRHDEGHEFAVSGADRGQDIDILQNHLLTHQRPQGERRPTPSVIADATEATFVLK